MTKLKILTVLFGLAAMTTASWAQQSQIQIWSAGFGPSKDIKVRNPKFVWQVWADGDAKITAASFIINGKEVDAKYDNRKKELFFESSEPMPPGTYSVVAKVKVDDWAKFDKKWTVTIRPDAVQNQDEIPADAKHVLGIFNQIRSEHGFGPIRFDPCFNLAATAHTNYLTLNKEGGHNEDPANPGYTGMGAADRVGLFGHVGSSWEVVSTGATCYQDGIIGLWDAPYHRISMMKPGLVIAGASYKDGNLTVDGDGMTMDGMFVSPPVSGLNIAPSWENNESPNPTRSFAGAEHVLGYPVVATIYGDKVKTISIVSASFATASGKEIERYELSPENDEHLKNSVILIPKKPLESGKTYSVNLKLKDNTGAVYTKAWKFTTR
ncbi:MAG: CAP domain-containing protein [Armatimonadota bacterium]